MTTITFIGGPETGNVGEVEWGRFTFALNRPVECNDPHIIAKANSNRFFKVDGGGGQVTAEVVPDDPAWDEPEVLVQAVSVPEATPEPPKAKRGRPPKPKAAKRGNPPYEPKEGEWVSDVLYPEDIIE